MRKVSGKEVDDFLKNHGDTEMGESVKKQLGIIDASPVAIAPKAQKDVIRPVEKVSSQTKKPEDTRHLWLAAQIVLIILAVTFIPLKGLVAIALNWLAWLQFRGSKK